MNWAIKDAYFEKVYGNSYKPKTESKVRKMIPSEIQGELFSHLTPRVPKADDVTTARHF